MMLSHRVISPIGRIFWAGWEATTLSLQKAGWQLSMEEDVYSMELRLAIKHPTFNIYGLSKKIDNRVIYEDLKPDNMIFLIQNMASDLRFQSVNLGESTKNYNAIDARPIIINNEKSIEDLFPFRKVDGKQLIVEPETVPMLLDKVLKMQSPKQKEIRHKLRKEAERRGRDIANPYTNIKQHAQIISLAV